MSKRARHAAAEREERVNAAGELGDLNHAVLDAATFGPRREVTLVVRPLIWSGQKAALGETQYLRLGGIVDIDAAKAGVAGLSPPVELARVWSERAERGRLRVHFMAERSDMRIVIECRRVSLEGDRSTESPDLKS